MSQREMCRLDPAIIMQQVNSLLLAFPELDEDEILRADTIEAETDLHSFLRMIEQKREDAVAMAEAVTSTIENLKARKMRFERRDIAMRALMFSALQWADLRKAELPEATLSIRDGVAKVVIVDEAQIPDDFMRIRKEPNKTAIKDALTSGMQEVPGAAMSNVEPVLAVRVK